MVRLNSVDPQPMSDTDDSSSSTIFTEMTPPATIAAFEDEDPLSNPSYGGGPGSSRKTDSSVPWPGHTFIIRDGASGLVVTLVDGRVVLARPGGPGSIHWACVENKGWLGFRNPISGRYLGHDPAGYLHCKAGQHQGWENFCVRLTPGGGYMLLMQHYERLWSVRVKRHSGMDRLVKMQGVGDEGVTWEFLKV